MLHVLILSQAHCAGRLSKSCDVYAFGVLLWEMWTGQRPWQGLGQMQIIFHLTQRKKRLQFTPGTPPKLEVPLALNVIVLTLTYFPQSWGRGL